MNNVESVAQLRAAYESAKSEQSAAAVKVSQCAEAMQAWCEHPIESIVEAPFQEMQFFDSLPPIRMCELCGITEDSWGSGHKILAPGLYSGLRQVDRDYIYTKRITVRP